eukprot:TRINITY_DN3369_c0_g1_i1.p1 TRINITY_DN3369_c0_g1~~TRINITY_DN3369_c0_g1_i1.p1  ORF type:complete len:167 (+),score=24.57 TRINITY_DN3369_c0_g1_i1:232-732(+)
MKQYYEQYHSQIEQYVQAFSSHYKNTTPLLIDLHGQSCLKDAVLRGTSYGRTFQKLISEFGEDVLIGDQSLFGELFNNGIDVYPKPGVPLNQEPEEMKGYSGGYTVRRYSGFSDQEVQLCQPFEEYLSSIQVEVGFNFRDNDEGMDNFSSCFASALTSFYNSYLTE